MSRILIHDLPELETLSEAESQTVFGAGRPSRRKTRDSAPGIVWLEVLEQRELMAAAGTALTPPTAVPAISSLPQELVNKDVNGNLVYRKVADGRDIETIVFTPAGDPLFQDQVTSSGSLHIEYFAGKPTLQQSFSNGVELIRLEFNPDGSLKRETLRNSAGQLAVVTKWTGNSRQVTEYMPEWTARVRTFEGNRLSYEELWAKGKRVNQTSYDATGRVTNLINTSGDYQIVTTFDKGIRDESTYYKGIRTSQLRYSTLEAFSALFAAEKQNHSIANVAEIEASIRERQRTPIMRATWDNRGNLLSRELLSYAFGLETSQSDGKPVYRLRIDTQKTVYAYEISSLGSVAESKEVFLNVLRSERTYTTYAPSSLDVASQVTERWNNSGDLISKTTIDGKRTQTEEFATVLSNGQKGTYLAKSTTYYDGGLEMEWTNSLNGTSSRILYNSNTGKKILEERFTDDQWFVSQESFLADGRRVFIWQRLDVFRNERERQVYVDGKKVLELRFGSTGPLEQIEIDGDQKVFTLFNEDGLRIERRIYVFDTLQMLSQFDPTTQKPTLLEVYDEHGRRSHKSTWKYDSRGNEYKISLDFDSSGVQIQERTWVIGIPERHQVWTGGSNSLQIVNTQYHLGLPGHVLYHYEFAPNGKHVYTKSFVPLGFDYRGPVFEYGRPIYQQTGDEMVYTGNDGLSLSGIPQKFKTPELPREIPESPIQIPTPKEIVIGVLDAATGGSGEAAWNSVAEAAAKLDQERLEWIASAGELVNNTVSNASTKVRNALAVLDRVRSNLKSVTGVIVNVHQVVSIDLPVTLNRITDSLTKVSVGGDVFHRSRLATILAASARVTSPLAAVKTGMQKMNQELGNKALTVMKATEKAWIDTREELRHAGGQIAGAWQAVKAKIAANDPTWTTGLFDARVYRIVATPVDPASKAFTPGSSTYNIKAWISSFDARAVGISIFLGQHREFYRYIPTGGNSALEREATPKSYVETFEVQFTPPSEGDYRIEVSCKDIDNKWFETRKGTVHLPTTTGAGVEVYYDKYQDPGYVEPGTTTQGPKPAPKDVSRPVSDAEKQRGFAFGEDELVDEVSFGVTPTGELQIAVEMTEVTDQTEVWVHYQKVNAHGEPINWDSETSGQYDRRMQSERDFNLALMKSLADFEEWVRRQPGQSSVSFRLQYEDNKKTRATFEEPAISYEEWLQLEYSGEWNAYQRQFNPKPPVRLVDALDAPRRAEQIDKVDRYAWKAAELPSRRARGSEILRGIPVSQQLTESDNGYVQVTITASEVSDGLTKKTITPSTLINKGLVQSTLKNGRSNWRVGTGMYAAAVPAFESPRISGRSKLAAQKARILRYYENQEAMKKYLRDEAPHDVLDILSNIPLIGVFFQGGNAVLYAKQGETGMAMWEGGTLLFGLLVGGFRGTVVGQKLSELGESIGKLLPWRSGQHAIELNPRLTTELLDGAPAAWRTSLANVKQNKEALKAAGIAEKHALQLGFFAANYEKLVITRAANINSIQFQGKAGYLPKPVTLKLKTAPDGLVRGTRDRAGFLRDALGNNTSFLVNRTTGRIRDLSPGQPPRDTSYYLKDGLVVDAKGNKFYSDYDLMGIYEQIPGRKAWASVNTNSAGGSMAGACQLLRAGEGFRKGQ